MSESVKSEANTEASEPAVALESEKNEKTTSVTPIMDPTTSSTTATIPTATSAHVASKIPTPATSVTGIPVSKLKAPSNFGSNTSVSKIGRPCCTHTPPKAGPPPRDTNSMSRESDDNLSSINSTYTDLYQETVKRFTRSSLSPTSDWERGSSARRSFKSNATSSSGPKSLDYERGASYDNYLEATGRRRSSDHGAVLTADTEQFIIGHRVWVGGIRPGQIAYIGETHFAPGEWAGIVLDEPNGKNDGCVAGKRYFQCEPKRGIFSRLTRLTLLPLAGALTPTSPLQKFSPERSRTVSPTASIRSSLLRSPSATGKNGLTVGDRIIVSSGFGSRPGILRYLGETQFAPGNWCGVELDEASGKNDGAVDGVRYFECKPKYGVFVPIAKVSLSPSSKKSRLSRTGSRESLTSIGTMNSIATTNTSRMRMNAQRKSSVSLKTVTTPKSQFSMQDLLRDKQNHIEQLMIERDLDREDAQNQALQLQKNISELKARIVHLEGRLAEERKKSEELQFSIDEATFCGDELNAQTHIYKEKIHDLEKKITQLVSASPSLQSVPTTEDTAALEAANARVIELESKLAEEAQLSEARNKEQLDEEKRLQENIKYLQSQNEILQKELVEKDESLEKFSLSEVGIENLRRELKLLKEENEKQSGLTNSEFQQKLAEKQDEIKSLTDELAKLKSSFATLESERAHAADEVGVLHIEVKSRDDQLQQLTQQVDELQTQLSVQQAENTALDELLKTQQTGNTQGQNDLAQKVAELNSLKAANEQLERVKSELESKLQAVGEQLKGLVEQQQIVEQKLKEANSAELEKDKSLLDFEAAMKDLKAEVAATSAENDKLREECKNLGVVNEQARSNEAALKQEIELKQKACQEHEEQNSKVQIELEQARSELETLKKQESDNATKHFQEAEAHNAELTELREKLRLLESQSSTSANEKDAQIAELEQRTDQQAAEIKQTEEKLSEARNKNNELQSQHVEQRLTLRTTVESLETTKDMLNKLTQDFEAVKANGKDLEAQLKTSEESKAKSELELGDLRRKHEALVAKCDNISKQNETLQADILAAQSNGADLQGGLKKLNEEIAAKQKAYVELEAQSNAVRLSNENEIETLKQSVANAQKDFAELKESLTKTKDELAAKNTQITVLEEKTIKQELAISDASRQQENLQARYDSLVGQNESLQQDLTTLRTSSTDSNAELLKVSQDIVAKQKAYEELSEKSSGERAALEGQLQASQQRVDALCSQVETLTQELKSGTEQSFQRLEQLKAAEEQAGKQTLELSDLGRKLETLTAQNEKLTEEHMKLQTELNSMLSSNTDTNTKLVSLNEKLANKQKELDSQTDKYSAERLQLESQVQDLNQRLQANQTELDNLRAELVTATDAQTLQVTEFANLKAELSTKARSEVEETKSAQAAERQRLIEDYDAKLKNAEQAKKEREDTVQELQMQLKKEREELLKTQTESVKKAEELERQLIGIKQEKEKLNEELQQEQNERAAAASSAEHIKSELEAKLQQLSNEMKAKEAALLSVSSESEQLKLLQSNATGDIGKLQETIKELEEKLEITNTEVAHRVQVARDDAQKMDDLRTLLETVKQSNASISATNAELSTALEVLEAEKCETAHIFEIFEMETDRNAEHLFEKLSGMKQELADTRSALAERESSGLEMQTKLQELQQANTELQEELKNREAQLAADKEFDIQLVEYKKVIDEMDEAATEKSTKLEALQKRVQELEQALAQAYEVQQTTQLECKNLVRKLESVELEKTREILALKSRVNGSSAQVAGGGDGVELGDNETNLAQINFLNSIIADMQKKNDTLKAKIDALEALPTDFTKPNAFDMFTKRKPAPRVFCDICDEFDKHETEDCPLQASDDRDYSPPPFNRSAAGEANNNDEPKVRKLPPPRKYCDSCEVFGHETGECDDETY